MKKVSKVEINTSFGKILREYRIKNNLTQDNLAEKLGISIKYISRVENGVSGLKNQTLIKCMNILGITPNVLFQDFISNKKLTKDIELANKISSLSDKKKIFILKTLDVLENTNEENL